MLLLIAFTLTSRKDGWHPFVDTLASMAYLLLALATLASVIDVVRTGRFPAEYDYNCARSIFNNIAALTTLGIVTPLFLLMLSERLNRNLTIQAMCDPLTGLYNRRAFEEIAFRELSGAARTGLGISLAMIDIDHFKQFNDAHGHAAGDAALILTAATLRRTLRDEDFLCRWGGDEFCALLPRVQQEQAKSAAERILHAFSGLHAPADGRPVRLSVSLGLVTSGDEQDGLSTLVQQADEALYQAKLAGRSCFVIGSGIFTSKKRPAGPCDAASAGSLSAI